MSAASDQQSGVLGLAGRVGLTDAPSVDTATVRLGGRPLPLFGTARLYVCGITPYDVTHLGHAATFVWADAAAAVARLAGANVITCRNVTDVDDMLIRAAATRARHYDEFALSQEYLFTQDMSALRVRRPEHEPRARHHIGDVVQLAAALLAGDQAYEREGTVYFRGAAVPGQAGLDRSTALSLAREYGDEPDDPLRDDPFDVAVWRRSDPAQPAWPSPWGWGRPGWHAECAAMAHAVLGGSIDILAGGADLSFPHHAYQVAMAQAATAVTPFARGRLQVGTVDVNGAKMAKSTGNLVLVADVLREHSPSAVRLLLLNRKWSQGWDYRPAEVESAAAVLERLYSAAGVPGGDGRWVGAVAAALRNDLDVPAAVAIASEARGAAARLLLRALSLT